MCTPPGHAPQLRMCCSASTTCSNQLRGCARSAHAPVSVPPAASVLLLRECCSRQLRRWARSAHAPVGVPPAASMLQLLMCTCKCKPGVPAGCCSRPAATRVAGAWRLLWLFMPARGVVWEKCISVWRAGAHGLHTIRRLAMTRLHLHTHPLLRVKHCRAWRGRALQPVPGSAGRGTHRAL